MIREKETTIFIYSLHEFKSVEQFYPRN